MRELVEYALEAGRKRLSQETGWIHFSAPFEEVSQEGIPLFENTLYILALFRSRLSDHVNEAKERLAKLLHFQVEGNFPRYLHEYPTCRDHLLALRLFPSLFLIERHFAPVLGAELKKKLGNALDQISSFGQTVERLPKTVQMLFDCIREKRGEVVELAYHPFSQGESLQEIGNRLFLWQLGREDEQLGQFAKECFDGRYVGPGWHELQVEKVPAITLFHLFLFAWTAKVSVPFSADNPLWLQGAQVFPFKEALAPCSLPLFQKQESWWMVRETNYSVACLEQKSSCRPHLRQGRHYVKLFFDQISLVSQGGNVEEMSGTFDQGKMSFHFSLGESPPFEERAKCSELLFFFTRCEDLEVKVEGVAATTFQLGQPVEIITPSGALSLSFSLEEGTGEFMGHLMFGNRLAQVATKGKRRFEAYDWKLFLRTLRRSEICKVRVDVEVFSFDHSSCPVSSELSAPLTQSL